MTPPSPPLLKLLHLRQRYRLRFLYLLEENTIQVRNFWYNGLLDDSRLSSTLSSLGTDGKKDTFSTAKTFFTTPNTRTLGD
ncbi:uncharacterized protein ARMOST_22335 [Armillaria ostoyae]|uniref:Uncharacterized protein n=1 Tax=Armillaria ostoyae TaxID=47428 RepID=A0A284SCK2_ARMOS|nr:uncharacterized protein ARMOST_22335 [Armillaria ostoyae]